MPHIIIEHSSDIAKNSINHLGQEIQNTMAGLEGNFNADQCKYRSFSFDQYLVGTINHDDASFIHVTLKILAGRNLEIRQNLAKVIAKLTNDFVKNANINSKRFDISIDVVEMDAQTYQKIRIGS